MALQLWGPLDTMQPIPPLCKYSSVNAHTTHTHTDTYQEPAGLQSVSKDLLQTSYTSEQERETECPALSTLMYVCLSLCCVLPARRPRQTSSSTQFLLSFQGTKQSTSEEQCTCACTVNVGLCVDVHTCVHEFVSVFD